MILDNCTVVTLDDLVDAVPWPADNPTAPSANAERPNAVTARAYGNWLKYEFEENGGTTVGGMTPPKTLLPAPMTVPVLRTVPIPVFTWSPRKHPTFSRPVSCSPSGVHTRTDR